MSLSDSDVDFDDPRFLVDTPSTSSAPLSYQERRKRKLIESEEKGRTKSRKQLEEETRETGLGTNLIERAKEDEERGGASKAFRMMSKMGFKPGEALGRKSDSGTSTPDEAASGGGGIGSRGTRGGLGFTKAAFAPVGAGTGSSAEGSPAPSATEARTEPIKFEMRTGRTGLGVPQPKRFLPYLSAPPSSSSASTSAQDAHYASLPLPDLEGYLSRLRSSMDDRRAFGLLRSARRTCEELDRRAGIEDSPMWRDPDEVEREEQRRNRRRLFERVDKEVESDEEDAKKGESLFGAKEDEPPKGKTGRGDLAYETGVSATVVETEEEEAESAAKQQVPAGERTALDVEEEAEWFSYDVRTRLALTLTYLRNKYNYCLWCGCQYNDRADLDANCPGEAEEDH
ncbi:coiled-coil domain-containing protein 75-like protein [Rhodotorula toruloides]|uniref:Coiled-coil domain-containing protein 75-like protein n=1 Tax=Rhodotorula toruloides TaxID=5286 RepID=A0A511KA28_RHOTO|nr:coiled-coil domain-containing protein 75-like protein [Rhodotorula toruloides]